MGGNSSRDTQIGETCVICQQNVNNNISRPSCCDNHYFHHKCLLEWSKHKNTCPLDNKEFDAIIDRRGKRIEVKKPQEEEEDGGLSDLFSRMLALHHLLNMNRFNCGICNREDSELERSNSDVCNHKFHRKCHTRLARISNMCPAEDCELEFNEIQCEFGEVISAPDLQQPISCQLCKENVEEDQETATPDNCAHRFHRHCLLNHAKSNQSCPITDCQSNIKFLRCENGEHIVIQNSSEDFDCSLCQCHDREKESAKISPCGHLFHRECILNKFREISKCPHPDCDSAIDCINCQFGDIYQKSQNPLNRLIAVVTCQNDFQCSICNAKSPELERAKLQCGCEFHRDCIIQEARTQEELLCPSCRGEYSTIHCLFGDTLSVQRRTSQRNSPNGSMRNSLTNLSDPSFVSPFTSSSENDDDENGATGGLPENHTCNLCDANIRQSEGCHPKDCNHWYHRNCITVLSNEIGCCIICQGNVNNVVDENNEEIIIESTSNGQLSNNNTSNCYTCGESIASSQRVRPSGCSCLFHQDCLVKIKEIMQFCPICGADFDSIVEIS